MNIACIVGARPNFMKIAPILRAMRPRPELRPTLIHTGQHYDAGMSDVFLRELEIGEPDLHLGVGSGSQAVQTGKVMVAFEAVMERERADLVLVVGDVNSTLACSLVAAKAEIPVAHVEAGLRSFDRSMPEEINRIVTDSLSTWLFTTSPDADENLQREGASPGKIHRVGNVMIDTLMAFAERAEGSPVREQLRLEGEYALLTLHRPSNVDGAGSLRGIFRGLEALARRIPVIFPVHPRTARMLKEFGIATEFPGFRVIEPLGYLDFIHLERHARLVLTDSGGIQEETTVLGVPCLTLRNNTERPITLTQGTNVLVGNDPDRIVAEAMKVVDGEGRPHRVPDLWDGKAAERIAEILAGEARRNN
jgi:UDP-N-acetylglucosamine 2-epimerase (non-hydrolysing)